jgi:nitrate reductase NapAB chaperone NapD
MGISAVALTLSASPNEQRAVVAALAARPHVVLGPSAGAKQALVIDAPSRSAERSTLDWIESLPGVLHVALVLCTVDDATEPTDGPSVE